LSAKHTPGPWKINNNIGRKGELGIIADAAYSHSSSLDLILPFETWQEINKPIFEQALKGDKEAE